MMASPRIRPLTSANALPGCRVVLVAAGLSLIALVGWLHQFYHDDAYISLRYAKNFLEGQGFVWNPGERVEGYTSFLWVLGAAVLGRLGVDLETASRLMGLGSLMALLGVLSWRQGRPGAVACLLVATSGPMIAWSFGGLETVGFAFLLTAALLVAERVVNASSLPSSAEEATWTDALAAGALFGVAELCRPEAPLFFGVVALMLVPGSLRSRKRRALFAAYAVGFAVFFLSRLAWRISFYGELFPNTFAVKARQGWGDLVTGSGYLVEFLLWFPALTLLAVLGLVLSRGKRVSRGETAMVIAVVLYLVYVALIGGDHMQWFRFIIPVLPISALLVGRRIEASTAGVALGRVPVPVVVLLLCALNVGSTVAVAVEKQWVGADWAARHGRLVGLHIRDSWPADSLVALNTAGSTPYFSGFRSIDMLGLNDRTIARRKMPPLPPDLPWARVPGHRKGDGAYVLSRRPDYIILGGSEGDVAPWFVGDKDIVDNPLFSELYVLRQEEIPQDYEPGTLRFRYFELKRQSKRHDTADAVNRRNDER